MLIFLITNIGSYLIVWNSTSKKVLLLLFNISSNSLESKDYIRKFKNNLPYISLPTLYSVFLKDFYFILMATLMLDRYFVSLSCMCYFVFVLSQYILFMLFLCYLHVMNKMHSTYIKRGKILFFCKYIDK